MVSVSERSPRELTPEIVESIKNPTTAEVASMDAWWRANNYLTIGQIYLQSNPLNPADLTFDDIKPRLLGHWGTSPGLAFMYTHVSDLVKKTDQDCVFITGPGHGGPALVGASYLEESYTSIYPDVTLDREGMTRLFRQFSAPGGIPSHVSVTTPGSIHEGGELGYALVHAFGAVFDNPDLLSIAVVGDGEAETGPLEGSWKGISFLNPERDGAVLPILHLNGAKIAGPTVLGRKDPEEVRELFRGHGYEPIEVEGDDYDVHIRFARALGEAYEKIRAIQDEARAHADEEKPNNGKRPVWPMIIFRSPKGWTGPHEVDGTVVEGTWRSHQVPLAGVKTDADHLEILKKWLLSYKPEELFDATGHPTDLVLAANPSGDKRMSMIPAVNAGVQRALKIRDLSEYEVTFSQPGVERRESTRTIGEMMRDFYIDNPDGFRLFCPDETNSNRLGAVFEASDRCSMERTTDLDVKISRKGRVMEVLSEHNCHGWLEGYVLTGRNGLFASYEAFGLISASQTVQHGKWLEEAGKLAWRKPIPSLNILLSSTCWRNDHNGFSHQGPGLIENALSLRGDVSRVFLPVDANTLAVVAKECFESTNRVNLIVQDKQPQLQYLTLDEAKEHVAKGFGIWDWCSNEGEDGKVDVILASAGDVVTMEVVAAAQILREKLPDLKFRVVNIVNLTTLARPKDNPCGMSDIDFTELFTDNRDVVFAFHGYPGAVHKLVHGRPDADRFHVRGFIEEGTTTTPFDMVVRNRADRYHLVMDAINNSKHKPRGSADLKRWCQEKLDRHEEYKVAHLEDMPEVANWTFGAPLD
ncbi:phosphoketolase family protein [Arcanobacterium haemolyticum]|nr:phosphoketolase family protein [Arcanobacterium haemolyticum]